MTRSRKRSEKPSPSRKPSPANRPMPLRARLLTRARTIIMAYLPTIAIVLGTKTLLAEAYRIPSGSMEPTLQVGDWLFVNKLRLGPHIPFTDASLPGYADPRRNDVVVFVSPPQDPSIRISPNEVTPMLVKRIVGVPGDTLSMRGGSLTVNGVVVPPRSQEPLLPDQSHPLFVWQHRIEAATSRFGPPVADPTLHEWGPLVIPAGTYFMMGDNRDNSVDSRYYGLVPRANLRGTPTFVYYSFETTEGLDYFRALTEIRWRRLGTWIR
jgi:signal peptidase I